MTLPPLPQADGDDGTRTNMTSIEQDEAIRRLGGAIEGMWQHIERLERQVQTLLRDATE